MREGVIATATGVLLGGALALGLSAGQDTGQRQGETPERPPAANTLAPASTYTLTPDAIDCTEFISPRECRTTIFVRPGTSAPSERNLQLKAVLVRGDGDDIAESDLSLATECVNGCGNGVVSMKSGEPAKAVRVTFNLPRGWRDPFSPQVGFGFLGIVDDKQRFDGPPKRLRILAPSPSHWQVSVLLVPGILALLVAAAVGRCLSGKGITLHDRMGAPSWRAAESWSSNLTVGAGLVNAVLALAIVSDFTVFMTKPSYGVLSMLLGVFVLLAPIVYGISRRQVNIDNDPANQEPANILLRSAASNEFEGSVRVFLIAGVLTLWASGGQLLTFALLMLELWRFGVLSGVLTTILVLLVIAVLAGLLAHGFDSMVEAAQTAKKPLSKTATGREARRSAERAPSWSLL